MENIEALKYIKEIKAGSQTALSNLSECEDIQKLFKSRFDYISYEYFPEYITSEYRKRLQEELADSMNEIIFEAALTYDENKGATFVTYVTYKFDNAIMKYLKIENNEQKIREKPKTALPNTPKTNETKIELDEIALIAHLTKEEERIYKLKYRDGLKLREIVKKTGMTYYKVSDIHQSINAKLNRYRKQIRKVYMQ